MPNLSGGALHKAEPTRRANSGPCSGRSPREHVSPSLIANPRVHPDGYAGTTIEALRPADRPWRASAVSSRCIYPNWRPNFRSTRKDRIFSHKTHKFFARSRAKMSSFPRFSPSSQASIQYESFVLIGIKKSSSGAGTAGPRLARHGISGVGSSPLYTLVGGSNPNAVPSLCTTSSPHGRFHLPSTRSFMNV